MSLNKTQRNLKRKMSPDAFSSVQRFTRIIKMSSSQHSRKKIMQKNMFEKYQSLMNDILNIDVTKKHCQKIYQDFKRIVQQDFTIENFILIPKSENGIKALTCGKFVRRYCQIIYHKKYPQLASFFYMVETKLIENILIDKQLVIDFLKRNSIKKSIVLQELEQSNQLDFEVFLNMKRNIQQISLKTVKGYELSQIYQIIPMQFGYIKNIYLLTFMSLKIDPNKYFFSILPLKCILPFSAYQQIKQKFSQYIEGVIYNKNMESPCTILQKFNIHFDPTIDYIL